MHVQRPEIIFQSPAHVVVSGADFGWHLNGVSVHRCHTIRCQAGDVLVGSSAVGGVFGYVAIGGHIWGERHYGSQACYPACRLGANAGRCLRPGDRIEWHEADSGAPLSLLHVDWQNNDAQQDSIFWQPGPEFEELDDNSRQLLGTTRFRVADISRMATKLAGPRLHARRDALESSAPVFPGIVQLLPAGDLVVLQRDCQTTGGYPRVGFLPEEDLRRLAQMPAGSSVRFSVSLG